MSTVKIQLEIDLKQIRKAFVLNDLELPSDEEILEKMGKEPTVIDMRSLGKDGEMALSAMSILAIIQRFTK